MEFLKTWLTVAVIGLVVIGVVCLLVLLLKYIPVVGFIVGFLLVSAFIALMCQMAETGGW